MAETINIPAHDDHVDTLSATRKAAAKIRGTSKSKDGYSVPKTTYDDVWQLAKWWHGEIIRAIKARPLDDDPAREAWIKAYNRVRAEAEEPADPDAVYPANHWFWNRALLKLAIYLQSQKGKPTAMSLFIDSLEETVDDRITDVRDVIQGAGEVAGDAISAVSRAAEAVSEVGERTWSGIKTAAIIGGGLIGAAIIVPPIIRAIRD